MKTAILAIILTSIWYFVGWLESKDDLGETELYCEMVQLGLWPDYDNGIDCEVLTE